MSKVRKPKKPALSTRLRIVEKEISDQKQEISKLEAAWERAEDRHGFNSRPHKIIFYKLDSASIFLEEMIKERDNVKSQIRKKRAAKKARI